MGEKLFVPLILVILYVLLSGGFMFSVGGNSSGMKVIFKAATIFVTIMVYSIAWHEELSGILGFSEAWILTTVLGAGAAVFFAIHRFRAADRRSNSDQIT